MEVTAKLSCGARLQRWSCAACCCSCFSMLVYVLNNYPIVSSKQQAMWQRRSWSWHLQASRYGWLSPIIGQG